MKLIYAVTIISVLFGAAFAQNTEHQRQGKLTLEKSGVYLEYACDTDDNIRLRINNNTSWHIGVSSSSMYFHTKPVKLAIGNTVPTFPNDMDIRARYSISFNDPKDETLSTMITKEYNSGWGGGWIGPGNSLTFSVPKTQMKPDVTLSVNFNYEWELQPKGIFNEPEHLIKFHASALSPDGIKKHKQLQCVE